jgi:cytidylate kinase
MLLMLMLPSSLLSLYHTLAWFAVAANVTSAVYNKYTKLLSEISTKVENQVCYLQYEKEFSKQLKSEQSSKQKASDAGCHGHHRAPMVTKITIDARPIQCIMTPQNAKGACDKIRQ